ncbi:hypothetical protein ACLS0M_04050 [Avibacterium avium]
MSCLYTIASTPPAEMLAVGLKDMFFERERAPQRQHIVGVDNTITNERK